MGHRYRWWYRLTGLPGWMRFGFSPGWIGWNPTGLGPAAQYMMYGSWPTPQMNALWQSGMIPPTSGYAPPPASTQTTPSSATQYTAAPGPSIPGFATPYDPWGAAQITPEQELDILKGQAEMLEDELDGIKARIKELEGGGK